jgi:hypothetical protein
MLEEINQLQDAMNATLEYGDIEPFLMFMEKILQNLSNRDFQRFNEKSLKISMLSLASMANFYYIRSEREIKNDGYIDLEFLKHPSKTGEPFQYIFELKYLKQADEDLLKSTMQTAKAQLKSYLEIDIELQKLNKFIVVLF